MKRTPFHSNLIYLWLCVSYIIYGIRYRNFLIVNTLQLFHADRELQGRQLLGILMPIQLVTGNILVWHTSIHTSCILLRNSIQVHQSSKRWTSSYYIWYVSSHTVITWPNNNTRTHTCMRTCKRAHTHTHTHTHKTTELIGPFRSTLLKPKESQHPTGSIVSAKHGTVTSHSAVGAFCVSNTEEPYCPETHGASGDIRCCNSATTNRVGGFKTELVWHYNGLVSTWNCM
jgi:hypothetical protein